MLNATQKLELLNAEIALLEKQCDGDRWRPRLIELLERRAEVRRELNLDVRELEESFHA